ncbi:hyaluronidase A-like [Periplaneta americana]|uniref:hyaluronidase A-like n=1 Tax=Periplaneta americana TaxID=6978 RepID=UPI0037E9C847
MRQWCELPLLLLLLLLVGMAATKSRLEKPQQELRVYWNAPTFMCHRYGVNFSTVRNWGIVQNSGDVYHGDNITVLYDPGKFPALLTDKDGVVTKRNGGVPQEGNLKQHLEKLREHVSYIVPDINFEGLGIIDFEFWRPIFRQNWARLEPYKTLSIKLERERHPLWSDAAIKKEAKRRFEKFGSQFLLSSLKLLKQMRPNGLWGYYSYPNCFNYVPNNMKPFCPRQVCVENDELNWLFEKSKALYPSLSLRKELRLTTEQLARFITERLNEAVRVRNNVPQHSNLTVNAYFWYKYQDVDRFVSEEDIRNVLSVARRSLIDGVIIWGSFNDVESSEKCKDLEKYVNTVLGPMIKNLTSTPRDNL